jgi:uncharacterized membrane protein
MNTVFKFHENVWLLAGLAGGVGLTIFAARVRGGVPALRRVLRWRWQLAGAAEVLLAAGLVYPVSAVATRLRERPPGGPTLDGVAFLAPDEAAAVRWLRAQNQSLAQRVIVAEAVGGSYTSAARMATYSGAAAVLGWAGHELQWRGPLPELGRREGDLTGLYRDAAPDALRPILARYQVQYVVVGDLERQQYGDGVESRFEGVLPVAFRSGRTVIYRAR